VQKMSIVAEVRYIRGSVKVLFNMTFKFMPLKLRFFFSVLLHMDMNSYILHTQKHTLLRSWTLGVTDGSTTHQDAWILPSFTHLLYCTTYSKFLNPPAVMQQPLVGQGPLITVASRSHSDTPHSCRTTLDEWWPDAKTPMWQHTTLTRDRHPCPGWDSNSQSQQAIGGRPTPYATWPLGSARIFKYSLYSCGAIGWGTVLQIGRPQVHFLIVPLEFFIDIILPAVLWLGGLHCL
jgi:hypothetical protein